MTLDVIQTWTTRLVSRPLAWTIYGGLVASRWIAVKTMEGMRLASRRIVRARSAQAVG